MANWQQDEALLFKFAWASTLPMIGDLGLPDLLFILLVGSTCFHASAFAMFIKKLPPVSEATEQQIQQGQHQQLYKQSEEDAAPAPWSLAEDAELARLVRKKRGNAVCG